MLLWITVLVTMFLSIAAKLAADAWLHRPVALVGSFVSLVYAQNQGIAFGVRLPGLLQSLLILAALAVVFVLARRTARHPFQYIAFGCIIGGALANLLDRLRDGLVTDFVHVSYFSIFNVADSFITIGAALLLAEIIGIVRIHKK